MEKVRTEDAVGLTLCHDITAMYPGFKGALFKRGHTVKEEDIEKIAENASRGESFGVLSTLEPEDVLEIYKLAY